MVLGKRYPHLGASTEAQDPGPFPFTQGNDITRTGSSFLTMSSPSWKGEYRSRLACM